MNQQQFDAIRSKTTPTRDDIEALCQEVGRQRNLSQQNLEAYWEEQGKTNEAKRRAETAEAQLAIVSGLNEWHDLPDLPSHVGHYLAFWKEDGAWVAQYWPSGIEDESGNKGNWLTTPDGSIRPAPIAWRHLPSVPEKYAKQAEYLRA